MMRLIRRNAKADVNQIQDGVSQQQKPAADVDEGGTRTTGGPCPAAIMCREPAVKGRPSS